MQAWYPILDYAKSRNIPVMIGTWDDVPWGLYSEGYATAMADLAQYQVKERGYTNIRYLNALNEPDSKLPDFETWRDGARNLQATFVKRGLSNQISLVGPDTSWTNGWITNSDLPWNNSTFLGAYEWHHYERTCCNIQNGQVENYFRPIVERLAGPERPDSKPVLPGEMGWGYQSGPGDNQHRVRDYQYGIEMGDFALQIARAGFSGGAAWDLDDAMHNKAWGMWNIVDEPQPRPWFYSWALLSRYFPAGATLYKPTSPDSNLRLLAARSWPELWDVDLHRDQPEYTTNWGSWRLVSLKRRKGWEIGRDMKFVLEDYFRGSTCLSVLFSHIATGLGN